MMEFPGNWRDQIDKLEAIIRGDNPPQPSESVLPAFSWEKPEFLDGAK